MTQAVRSYCLFCFASSFLPVAVRSPLIQEIMIYIIATILENRFTVVESDGWDAMVMGHL